MPLGSSSHHGKCDGIIDTGRIEHITVGPQVMVFGDTVFEFL